MSIQKQKEGTTDQFSIFIRTIEPKLYFNINNGFAFTTKYIDVKTTITKMRKEMSKSDAVRAKELENG